jgi:hypothetical protein
MKPIALLLMLAGCSAPSDGWVETVADLPSSTMEVVDAVAALPECGGMRAGGGVIHWRAGALFCGGRPTTGCTYASERPPRIEVSITPSAWDGADGISTLAHEVCHVCGYTDEIDASACARRAREITGR